jgi:putative chitinase
MWFFDRNKLWDICDKGVDLDQIKQITKRVNGGYTGLDHRVHATDQIYGWLRG